MDSVKVFVREDPKLSEILALESPKNEKRLRELSILNEILLDYGKNLGVDLSERMPSLDRYHFFTPDNFQKVRAFRKLPESFIGYCDSDFLRYMYILENVESDSYNPLAIASHELIHALSYHKFDFKVSSIENSSQNEKIEINMEASVKRVGYYDFETEDWSLFNEGITEFINYKEVRKFWSKYPELEEHKSGFNCSYWNMVLFIRHLFLSIEHRTSKDVKDEFLRGYFTGETNQFGIISEIYGVQFKDTLASLKVDSEDPKKQLYELEDLL